ncbi:mitochondrial amidoxime-reducing component 1-like isoform X2 [Phymastichus coffea]|uniref:mitochondrial amidoxime-reducing component 1-like isoform X2 n=1 Tax=Phymastichus coffea TaxID=108790 RepID=UPI00273ADD31|nr:mitochondrial amidoxime-reducing component 1-like isoform X2 [Phymastichus coffea]
MISRQNGLNTFLVSNGVLVLVCLAATWYGAIKKKTKEKQLREKILSSPETSWKKVARVTELFCYPLKSGKAKSVEECYFSEYGIVADDNVGPIEDRMFVAYDEKTRKSVTAGTYRKLLVVKLFFVSKNRARLEVENALPLEFDLPDLKSQPVPITMWIGEQVNGIDCGAEPSRWLSRYLSGSDYGIRLAVRIPGQRRNVTDGPWKSYAKAYERLRNEDSGLFAYLASFMLISEDSVNDLNGRLDNPILPIQLRPNIVVQGCGPYAEDGWDWMKIGDRAIIRRFKLCTRCTMTTVNPETGIPDPKCEPLRTLRSYRKLRDPVLHKLEFYSPAMGVYCGLYRTGTVRVDDDVYVYREV